MSDVLADREGVPGLGLGALAAALRNGDRTALARAITLVESRRPADQETAEELLGRLLPATGGGHRIGVSGAPGAGKSTLIDALGLRLAEAGRRVAVLAVDPSSTLSGGSILGDKSRMGRLANHPNAFVRPSPSGLAHGGVAPRTRETLLLCEAAGFEIALVETVGVGQAELAVADLVDTFLVVLQPGSGDQLQGIKKGILELADLVAVNKADGASLELARETAAEYGAALRYLEHAEEGWRRPVVLVSALTGEGLPRLAELLAAHRQWLEASGELSARRRAQLARWLRSLAEERLRERLAALPDLEPRLARLAEAVQGGSTSPGAAAAELLRAALEKG